MKVLGCLILCSVLICTGGNEVYAKGDLNKVFSGFGINKDDKKSHTAHRESASLSEAKKNEIRLINSFLERLRTLKRQIEKEEKELIDAKEKLLLG